MTTVRSIVTNALRKIGVVDIGETPTGEEAADATTALNEMMHGLEGDGVRLNWSTKAVGDEFPLDAKHDEGVTYMLAEKIANDYRKPVTQHVASMAQKGRNRLNADFKIMPVMHSPRALRSFQMQKRW